jgi:glycerol-3-phosphate acyltransferase PlsY
MNQGAAITIPTAIGIIGHTIPPGRVKNYSFAFFSGGAPIGQVMGNILVSDFSLIHCTALTWHA